jgi:hypothetical protein
MKRKLLAALSLVMILAMESVTVFAVDSPTTSTVETPSTDQSNDDDDDDDSATVETTTTTTTTTTVAGATDVLYGNAGDDTITAEVAEATLDNMDIDSITDAVVVAIDEETGAVATDAGLVFLKDEDNGLQLAQTATGGATLLKNVVIKLEKGNGHESKPLTTAETKSAVSVAQYATQLGERAGANIQVSYAVSVQGSVDENGKPNKPVEFNIGGANLVNGNVTIIHITDDGKTENLGATVVNGKITSKKIPTSYSAFVVLAFDSPVPGLTTEIDYSTQSTSLTGSTGTISGDATSPKTGDAYPYAAATAVVALACALACSKKIAKQ